MKEIAEKNDHYRRTFSCKVVMTIGVAHSKDRALILEKVRNFYEFTKSNDPRDEHDFGNFEVEGTKYFFKFDYLDKNFEFYEEDGRRVLTIMRADEY